MVGKRLEMFRDSILGVLLLKVEDWMVRYLRGRQTWGYILLPPWKRLQKVQSCVCVQV